ncbi:MAG: hypothetical protein ACRC9K_06645 [Afipia sp.]
MSATHDEADAKMRLRQNPPRDGFGRTARDLELERPRASITDNVTTDKVQKHGVGLDVS